MTNAELVGEGDRETLRRMGEEMAADPEKYKGYRWVQTDSFLRNALKAYLATREAIRTKQQQVDEVQQEQVALTERLKEDAKLIGQAVGDRQTVVMLEEVAYLVEPSSNWNRYGVVSELPLLKA